MSTKVVRLRAKTTSSALLALALAIPFASARTGVGALDRVVELIARMFTIDALRNSYVQLGFIKFGIFLAVFAIANMGLKTALGGRSNGNKTAGVISFVISFTGAALMPEEWVFAGGGVITAIVSGAIPLALVGLGIYYSHKLLLSKHFPIRLLGLVIIFMLIAIINIFKDATGLYALLALPAAWLRGKR